MPTGYRVGHNRRLLVILLPRCRWFIYWIYERVDVARIGKPTVLHDSIDNMARKLIVHGMPTPWHEHNLSAVLPSKAARSVQTGLHRNELVFHTVYDDSRNLAALQRRVSSITLLPRDARHLPSKRSPPRFWGVPSLLQL